VAYVYNVNIKGQFSEVTLLTAIVDLSWNSSSPYFLQIYISVAVVAAALTAVYQFLSVYGTSRVMNITYLTFIDHRLSLSSLQ